MTLKEGLAIDIAEAMRRQGITKTEMAAMLKTSRRQLDRILDPTSDITLSTVERAALSVGCCVLISLWNKAPIH